MGKAKKEHRAKVAKRNKRIASEKSKMQKVFDALLQAQIDKFKESNSEVNTEEINNGLDIQVGGKQLEFNVVDPNELVTDVEVTESEK
jgi:N-methylhydantoinase A/oxoprolinase/acetone carboxylase beta subunit